MVYLARNILSFVMYCVYGESSSFLLIDSIYRLYGIYIIAKNRQIQHTRVGNFRLPIIIIQGWEIAEMEMPTNMNTSVIYNKSFSKRCTIVNQSAISFASISPAL